MSINYERIGERIQQVRKLRNLSINDVADKINFTPKSVIHAEFGRAAMNLDFFVPLCVALGVTPNDLLEGEFPPVANESLEMQLALEEIKGLISGMKHERDDKENATVIKDTETALDDIQQMVTRLRQEEKDQALAGKPVFDKYKPPRYR